jgi:NAD(P)-dependent dehydrogenase (short-subunit alcohol dehydrogenase family)
MSSLKGKVALVTGGRRGIGKAIALALAEKGADIAVADIEADSLLQTTVKAIQNLGVKSLAIQVDVAKKASVLAMLESTLTAFNHLDVLVNCAGIWIPGQNLVECSQDNWDKVINTNLRGAFFCCQAAGEIMIRQKSGCIINLSSEVGINPGTGIGAYSISKAGIIMLTRQLARELAPYHIRVNALAPGIVKTDFNAAFWRDPATEKRTASGVPLGRLAEPEDIAQAALFLASDAASYITGEILAINGGWHPG